MATRLAKPPLKRNFPLAPYTTFGIGGPADLLTTPKSAAELANAVGWARAEKLPWFVLGTGANVLVGDKGFRGLVIKNEATAHRFVEGSRLTAESGAIVGTLIDRSTRRGLSGLEHYVGIVSTVGGALWQNLHFLSYPHKRTYFIEEVLKSALILSGSTVKTVDRDYFQFGYDTSVLHQTDDIVLEATFTLKPESKEKIRKRRQKNLEWRRRVHPPNAARMSAGSIFQKIKGVGAGRLIDRAGLKGHRIGGAEVSAKHANYMLNVDNATAADVRALIKHVQQVVKKQTGHQLTPEVSFIGEF